MRKTELSKYGNWGSRAYIPLENANKQDHPKYTSTSSTEGKRRQQAERQGYRRTRPLFQPLP